MGKQATFHKFAHAALKTGMTKALSKLLKANCLKSFIE
jgi:hypothetical protein